MTRFVDCGEARIACEVTGSGPPLLLMHGAEATRHMFAELLPHLSTRFCVIAYDQRDCGETESPPEAATLRQLADDARNLLHALGWARAHVFGSSFGGRVAQALAALHPGTVDHLVLASTWALPHALAELNPQGAQALAALRAGLPHTAQELATWFFPEPFLVERPALRDIFAAVRPASERSRRREQAVADRLDIDGYALQAPTLLLAGALDRVVPPALTRDIALHRPGAEFVLLDGVGHATTLQAPATVAEHLIRFLAPETHRPNPKET